MRCSRTGRRLQVLRTVFIPKRKKILFLKKQVLYRIFFYVLGLLILALGLTLNTKAGLGVSPIISVSYSVSQIFTLNFGNTTMFLYCVFVLAQLLLHGLQWKQHPETDQRLVLLLDVLQIPLSLVFTRFLNLFGAFFPDLTAGASGWTDRLPLRLVVLLLAILCTGVGASMSLSMRIVPNPGDGIVQTLSDWAHRSVGLTKNCFDLCNITLTTLLGLLLAGQLVGIGLGTVLAMVGVGRVIALFQHLAGRKIARLSGMAA